MACAVIPWLQWLRSLSVLARDKGRREADGSRRRRLQPPVPMRELWFRGMGIKQQRSEFMFLHDLVWAFNISSKHIVSSLVPVMSPAAGVWKFARWGKGEGEGLSGATRPCVPKRGLI